jgi:hypothetical protein
MNSIQQYQVTLAVSLIIFSLSGCHPLPPQQRSSLPPMPPTSAATAPTVTTTPIAETENTKPTIPTAKTENTKPTITTIKTIPTAKTEKAKPTITTIKTIPTAKTEKAKPTITTKPTKLTIPTAKTERAKPTITTKPTKLTIPTAKTEKAKPTAAIATTAKRPSESFDPQRKSIFKPVAIADRITVTIYEVDSQCQALIPQKVPVKKEHPIEAAVSKVLEKQHSSDFDVSYRVILDRSEKLATIDLRVPANSRRQLVSLSSCEQLALFGSLRQTLTSNRNWEIQKVRFTKDGKEIWL